MLAILNSLNAHNLPIFQPILMIFAPKFMVHRALSDKTYLSFGLLSPLNAYIWAYARSISGLTDKGQIKSISVSDLRKEVPRRDSFTKININILWENT